MGILAKLTPLRVQAVAIVSRQIANIHAAQRQHVGFADTDGAAHIVTDGFLDWLAPQIASDINPDASAREICRELLCRVAKVQHKTDGAA